MYANMFVPSVHATSCRSNTAAIIVFQLSLSGDVHDLWLAVVDIVQSPSTTEVETKKLTPDSTGSVESSVPPLPVKSGSGPPPNPLPRNKEVIMYLEKVDS